MKNNCYAPSKTLVTDVQVSNDKGQLGCHFLNALALVKSSSKKFVYTVISESKQPLYLVTKTKNLFTISFYLVDKHTNKPFNIQKKMQCIKNPLFDISIENLTITIKKDNNKWSNFYNSGKEVARWLVKKIEYNKTQVQIEHFAPI